MTEKEQRQSAKEFAQYWQGKGYEKGQSQIFWVTLLQNVLGVAHPEQFISFEDKVVIDHTSFIDGYISSTHVLIEQKSLKKDLKSPIKQSDGSLLSPFQQAKRYSAELPYSQRPRWVVTCNFEEFHIYDMEKPQGEPEVILLKDLPKEFYRLQFLVDVENEQIKKEMEISIKAGELVGVLYDALLKKYKDPTNPDSLRSLNMLCVRLVFCLYAEDADIFGKHLMFHDYMKGFAVKDCRRALIDLFKMLDTPEEKRDPYDEESLTAFPYVNGGLFAEESIEIPQLDEEIVNLILANASEDFDWSEISPTIFGAVFESTLNPDTRRSGGMHYTSIENIHKVIDPLFFDQLNKEFLEISMVKVDKTRKSKLIVFQEKLSKLQFLDPACGSGNFLTETYISLRRLENQVLRLLSATEKFGMEEQTLMASSSPVMVGLEQFHGIEINDFAVTVAKTALWIAESQMLKETEEIVQHDLQFLPLKSYSNIKEGNALTLNWESVVKKEDLDYIMGNPPFVGYSLQTKEQKAGVLSVYTDEKGKPYKTAGKIDFVSAWYFKASQLIQNTEISVAFVSTNSITQGEQVSAVWKPLYERFGIHIDFAYQTFKWESEASEKAAVHCVIVGFSAKYNYEKSILFGSDTYKEVENISPYLIEAPTVFVESRSKPVWEVTKMVYGSKPADGGFLFFDSEEYNDLLKKEPNAEKFLRRFYGATEFLHSKDRYCLWLEGANPTELKKLPHVMERIAKVKEFRLASTKVATQKLGETPTLFAEPRQPSTDYLIVPRHSSEHRKYVPIGYMNAEIICGDANQLVPNATYYDFGILTSNVHMAWMRAICGRIKSDYRYSINVVYNNFPWCSPSDKEKAKIEETAQNILNAREIYPDSSLADLYDEVAMPPELRKAHQKNDKAVMKAYGFSSKMLESEIVAELMGLYEERVKGD